MEWFTVIKQFCCAEVPGFETWVGSASIFKIDFHQQKLAATQGSLALSVLC